MEYDWPTTYIGILHTSPSIMVASHYYRFLLLSTVPYSKQKERSAYTAEGGGGVVTNANY